jgi:hypothetical protein
MNRKRRCYCAFCKKERYVVIQKHIDGMDILLAALAGVCLTFVVWQDFDPRGILFCAIGCLVAEMLVHLRWRLGLVCPHCSFDPILYKKDRKLASERVKNQLALRKLDPRYLLAEPLNLPRVARSKNSVGGDLKAASSLASDESKALTAAVASAVSVRKNAPGQERPKANLKAIPKAIQETQVSL